MSEGPGIAYLGAPVAQTMPGWPQVVTAVKTISGAALAAFTARYDEPGDNMLFLYRYVGGVLDLLQQDPAGEAPRATLTIDFGHDGIQEVITALFGSDALGVYTSTLGLPPLAGPALVAQPGEPDGLAKGDFTGDLLDDLIVIAPAVDVIRIMRGASDGTLNSVAELPFPTDGFSDLAVGDFDNNGYDDLAVLRGAGYKTDSVVVFYQSPTGLTTATLSPDTGGFLPHSLAAGDMNGDGRDDLVVTAGGNKPRAFLNVYLQTDDGLVAQPVLASHHQPGPVAIGDINHDGRDDVVVLHGSWRTLSIYRQEAGGTLAAPDMMTLPYSSHYFPDSLTLADFDGNNSLDLAFAQFAPGVVSLYNVASAPTAVISTPAHATVVPAGSVTVTGTASAGAVRVQIRVRGLSDAWTEATLNGETWQGDLVLPDEARPWTIEARAIDAAGVVQAPPARVRVWSQQPLVGYAVADNSLVDGDQDHLVRFDPLTGTSEVVGPTGTLHMRAATFLPGSATLVAADGRYLGTLDLETGAFTRIGAPLGQGRNGSARLTFNNVRGLTADPATGLLYATMRRSNAPDVLFKVDPATGMYVPNAFGNERDFVAIQGSGLTGNIDDLAYEPATETLYAISSRDGRDDHLIRINPTTGAATVIGPTGVSTMEGLAFAPNGVLYGSTGTHDQVTPTSDRLWTIDPATGSATLVGAFEMQSDFESIAFVPAGVTTPPPTPQGLGNIAAPRTTVYLPLVVR
jgi:hypothetical protein